MKTKIFIACCLLAYIILSIVSAANGGDFDVYLDAAIKLEKGQNIYAPPFIKDLQYYYSPLFAMLLTPFTGFFFITQLVWLLLSGFLLYRIWVLIKKHLDFSVFNSKEKLIVIGLSFFFITRFILYNISMTQVSIFLLWAILESIHLVKNNRPFWGAALLAMAINIKLMPLVVLPYLIYRGYYKAFVYMLFCSLSYLYLPAFFIGSEFNLFLLAEWWSIINPAKSEHLIEAGRNAQSLVGTIPVFLTDTIGELPFKRNIFNLSIEITHLITNISRLALVLLSLFFLKSPFKENTDKLSELRGIAYILMIVPLIFPHQNKYAFIFIFPMVVYLAYYCMMRWKYNRTKPFKLYLVLLLFVSIVFTPIIGSDVLGRFTYDLIHHFRILGLATLSLIIFAILAKPKLDG